MLLYTVIVTLRLCALTVHSGARIQNARRILTLYIYEP